MSGALSPWRKPMASHDPGKIVLDLAVMVALGGDCAADVALLRGEPGVFGVVASDPTVSRMITVLAADAPKALPAIASARAAAGEHSPDHAITAETPLTIDLDATLLDAHSEKECAAPTFKKGYGFHPLLAFADHGGNGTGEPLAQLLRAGNASANTAADHKTVLAAALAQLPRQPWLPGWEESVGAHRFRWRHPRVRRLLHHTSSPVLTGVHPHRHHRHRDRRPPEECVDTRLRCRRDRS